MLTKLHLNCASADWEDCMASKSLLKSAKWRSKGLVTLRHLPVVCKYDQHFFYLHPARIIARAKTAEDHLHNALLHMLTVLGYSSCNAYPLARAHSTTSLHFIALTMMTVYHKTDNSFTELFTSLSASAVNCVIYMPPCTYQQLQSPPSYNSKIVQTPQLCKTYMPWLKESILCMHSSSEEWAASFTLCANVSEV